MTEFIAVEVDGEVGALLDHAGIDLVLEVARRLNLERRTLPASVPRPATDSGIRDVSVVLLSAGVSAVFVAAAISEIIDAIGRNKKLTFKTRVLKPVVDGNGLPVKDAAGEPVVYWGEEFALVEATQSQESATKATAHLGKLLKVELEKTPV